MQYIIIQPTETLTSKERTEKINKLLFDIVKHPTSTGTSYLFNVIEHPTDGLSALECIMDQIMPLQNVLPLAELVDELSDTVGILEAAQYTESMVGTTVTFADLIPISIIPKEKQEMVGWFIEETIE